MESFCTVPWDSSAVPVPAGLSAACVSPSEGGNALKVSYRCDEKINELLEEESKKRELTKNGLIDNIIRDYFSQPHDEKNVVTNKKIRNRNRMRNEEIIKAFQEIMSKYNELDFFLKSSFDTTWGCAEDTLEFERTVITFLINIAENTEKIRKELTR